MIEPSFFSLLDAKDKNKYQELRLKFSTPDHKYNRGKRVEVFRTSLEEIQFFCNKGDANDWKRQLVCGLCWNQDFLAINTRQLRLILNKCKSSINGALLKMGYSTLPIKGECCTELIIAIPFIKGNYLEQRQWSVRTKAVPTIDSVTPDFSQFPQYEPYTTTPPKSNKISIKSNILGLFGAIDGKIIEGKECTQYNISKVSNVNIYSDPMCCCPVEWVLDNDLTVFG